MKKAFAFAVAAASLAVAGSAGAATDGRDRNVLIENLSGQTLRELYASPVTSNNWEEDLLGSRVIRAGESLNANIDNGSNECMYDLKAVMANDKEVIRRRVNVCSVSRWTIGEGSDSVA